MKIQHWFGALCAALFLGVSSAAASDTRQPIEYFSAEDSSLPFSLAVRAGDILYLSGQIGMRPDGSFPEGIEAQTQLAMENIGAALELAGSSMDDVFKCTVMLENMSEWAAFNRVYLGFFTPGKLPARSSFGADGLALGALVEIECWAHVPASERAH